MYVLFSKAIPRPEGKGLHGVLAIRSKFGAAAAGGIEPAFREEGFRFCEVGFGVECRPWGYGDGGL